MYLQSQKLPCTKQLLWFNLSLPHRINVSRKTTQQRTAIVKLKEKLLVS